MTRNYLDILAETIRNNWDAPALTDFYLTEDGTAQDTSRGNHYTYGEMYAEICRVAELLTSLGLKKGDHIAICGANSAHWVIAYLAIAKIQGVTITIMQFLKPEEMARLIDFSDAKTLLVDSDLFGKLKGYPLLQVTNVVGLDDWGVLKGGERECSYLSVRGDMKVNFPLIEMDSPAMICFTSGTSGSSKGVMLSYRNINVTATFDNEIFRQFKSNNSLQLLPLAHLYGITTEILQPLSLGIHININKSILNARKFILACQIVRPPFLIVVPSILENIIGEAIKQNIPITKTREYVIKLLGGEIKIIGIGGAKWTQEMQSILSQISLPLLPGYGATECGPRISSYRNTDENKFGSSGTALNGVQISIDKDSGEILVKGENVMLGYYKDPEATAAKIDSDGWLHTGDKGYMDEDGYLYVTGRIGQDMIVLPNGENIHHEDIENKINALSEVCESVVVAREGKLVALVVLEQGARSKEQGSETAALKEQRRAILRAINPQLPLYSQLYDVEFLDKPLERTAKQTIKRYLYK